MLCCFLLSVLIATQTGYGIQTPDQKNSIKFYLLLLFISIIIDSVAVTKMAFTVLKCQLGKHSVQCPMTRWFVNLFTKVIGD